MPKLDIGGDILSIISICAFAISFIAFSAFWIYSWPYIRDQLAYIDFAKTMLLAEFGMLGVVSLFLVGEPKPPRSVGFRHSRNLFLLFVSSILLCIAYLVSAPNKNITLLETSMTAFGASALYLAGVVWRTRN